MLLRVADSKQIWVKFALIYQSVMKFDEITLQSNWLN